jgi:adenylate cyclase
MHSSFAPALDHPIETRVLIAFTDCIRWAQNAHGRPSADLFAELDDFYALTDRAVESANGLVVKYLGDAVLIAFPEEQADRGIMALLQLKREVDAWFKRRNMDSGLHVNLHFGEVTMGRLGSIQSLDIIGEAVNVCATLPHQGVTLSPQAFRCLTPENRRLFHRHTPPITYHPE